MDIVAVGAVGAAGSPSGLRVHTFPGDEIDDPSRDRHGVIAEPLVVAAAQGHVDRDLCATGPAWIEQNGEQPLVQLVHRVVVTLELSGSGDVTAGDDAGAPRADS